MCLFTVFYRVSFLSNLLLLYLYSHPLPATPITQTCAQIGDELLYRWIKDAHEYGAELPDGTGKSVMVLGADEVKDASGTVVREATTGLQTPEGEGDK